MGCRDPILVLICGYPAKVREKLLMPMFVAHVDESGNGGPIFSVGAMIAKATTWLEFSDDWQKSVLDAPPKIPYFKFSNPHQLSPESHLKKINAGISVINRHVARAEGMIVDVAEYEIHFRNLMGATYDNPIHFGYMHTVQQCVVGLSDPESKINFIFDEMDDTQYLELLGAFRRFKATCPDPHVARRLDQEPIRGNDKEIRPLQGADLWVGLFRAATGGDPEALALLRKIEIENRGWVWDAESLPVLLSHSVQRFPGLTSGKYYETKKARSKRLGPLRKIFKLIETAIRKKLSPSSEEGP